MSLMTAVEISSFGGPEVLVSTQRRIPEIGRTEVLIRVAAAGVNRPDVLQRSGVYPPPPGASDLPGLEVAGEVVAVADDGSETRSVGESSWAYGVERYEVITQRLPDGALRVRTHKTETVNTTPPAGPDDMFSTEDDQAARLSELAPVGSWTEVLIQGGARLPHMDPATSLKGWISMGDDQAATVGEARKLHDCK